MNNLLSRLKNLSGSTILLIVAALVIAFLVFKLRNQTPQEIIIKGNGTTVIDTIMIEAKKLAAEVDKKGYSKASFERKQAIIGNGDLSGLPISKAVFDSLRLDNIDKGRRLQEASYIKASLEARELRATKLIDSLKNVYYGFSDQFATVRFTPDSLGGRFNLGYNIGLIRHDYSNRKNFLSPRINYTDILSPDKRITINGLQSLTFSSSKATRFGIGLQAGYYYDPSQRKFSPAIGAGLSYNLINF